MLNALERFKAICRFERNNDPYFWSIDSWNEAFDRWIGEGMPVRNMENKKEVNELLLGDQDEIESLRPNGGIMGMSKNNNPPWCAAIDPVFELETIEESPEFVIRYDYDGSIVRRKKEHDNTIPEYLEYPVKDRKTWDEYKKRLDPFSSGRWSEGWDTIQDKWLQFPMKEGMEGKSWKKRDFPLGMNLLSLYGNPRNYMGVENISYAIYDEPKLVEEMIDHQAWLAYEMVKKVFDAGITLNWVWIWEDMCFNKGPLVSPKWVREFMLPRYRKITDLLHNNGVDALICDCDGNVDELMDIWIEAGINATYPLECAAGMDARTYRKRYGNDLIIFGNVDKRALAKGKNDIDAEVEKVKELISHSGYFINVDHHIPPDVSYENLVYFINEVRKLSAFEETRRIIK
jgi:uroporphyrinogen decarboxylase